VSPITRAKAAQSALGFSGWEISGEERPPFDFTIIEEALVGCGVGEGLLRQYFFFVITVY